MADPCILTPGLSGCGLFEGGGGSASGRGARGSIDAGKIVRQAVKSLLVGLVNPSDASDADDGPQEVQEGIRSGAEAKVCTSGNPTGGPDPDDDDEPQAQDLNKISSNKEANKVAQEHGYKDAHEAKRDIGKSEVNIYKDKKTGKYYVWDGQATSEPYPLK